MQQYQSYKDDIWWLLAILVLATVLRAVGLNSPLWYDEIITVDSHLRLPWRDMMDGYSLNFHYLFNFQSKLAITFLGEQNWVIRLPAMVFGVAGIAAIWVLARDIAGAKIAHVSALLLAMSYHHIWFSQNARGYSELAFLSTVGMILFLRGLERPGRAIWLSYGVVLALAVFTHLTGAFIFAAQGLVWLVVVLVRKLRGNSQPGLIREPVLGYLLGAALTLLFYAPILPSLISAVGGVAGTSTVDVMIEYQNPLWTVLEGVRTALGSTGILVGLVAVLVLGLSLLGGVAAHRRAPLYGPIVALHIVVTLALLVALGMRVWPRFFFADIGFLIVLIVLGVRMICHWFGTKLGARFGANGPALFIAATIAMVGVSAVLAARNYTTPKQNLIGAFEFVENTRTKEQSVYSVGLGSLAFSDHFNADWGVILNDGEYLNIPPGPALFVVSFPARTLRKVAALDRDTETKLTLLRRFPGSLGDGNILIFQRE